MKLGKMLNQTNYYPYLQFGIIRSNLFKNPTHLQVEHSQGFRTEHRFVFPFRITTSDTDMPIPLFDSSNNITHITLR